MTNEHFVIEQKCLASGNYFKKFTTTYTSRQKAKFACKLLQRKSGSDADEYRIVLQQPEDVK